jgi:hypothetical protein
MTAFRVGDCPHIHLTSHMYSTIDTREQFFHAYISHVIYPDARVDPVCCFRRKSWKTGTILRKVVLYIQKPSQRR